MQENVPVVSVLVLTYNQENTIRRTLDSILSQKTQYPYEIIIGEDLGIDNTRLICQEYTEKYDNVILASQDKNLGVVKNYFNAVSYARGKYLMGCAGDDYWHNPDKIQLQVDYMESHPECVICHTDVDILHTDIKGKIVHNSKTVNKLKIPTGYIKDEIYSGKENITAVTMCIRKPMFDKYIPVEDFIRLDFPREDWPILVILSRYGTIEYLPISTATYAVGHESVSRILDYEKLIEQHNADLRMNQYFAECYPEDFLIDEDCWESYKNEKLMRCAYRNHDYISAKKFAGLTNRQNLMSFCTANRLLFYGYLWLRMVKHYFE